MFGYIHFTSISTEHCSYSERGGSEETRSRGLPPVRSSSEASRGFSVLSLMSRKSLRVKMRWCQCARRESGALVGSAAIDVVIVRMLLGGSTAKETLGAPSKIRYGLDTDA
ncbi:hypothetical protein EDB85DRAFT_1893332 [Lactarius pseudohatsudake]|nr:hypothetical protein EDB85DRAFT_1893332 [Lactarius pseudohatsudake]